MREPFTAHAALLRAVREYQTAERKHNEAKEKRRAAIRAAVDAGYKPVQVGQHFGLSRARVEQILKEATR